MRLRQVIVRKLKNPVHINILILLLALITIEKKEEFYLGTASNAEAKRRLRGKRKGTFCVRYSEKFKQNIINTNNKV